MKELSLKERRLFFFSFITMLFGLHFMFHFITARNYQIPYLFFGFFIVYVLPELWQVKVSETLLKVMEPLGRFNSTILFGFVYYVILYPISLFRGSEVDLSFYDTKRESYLIASDKQENDFKNPY
jgi:hypothetical protein